MLVKRMVKIMWMLACFGYHWQTVKTSKILMITLAGTKSHKIPFLELGRGLTIRGHNVTFVSAFPNGKTVSYVDIEEINPFNLVAYVKNFTNWDLLGRKMQGKMPVSPIDIFKFGYQVCEAFLSDEETKHLLLERNFDLLILDGAYPECGLGLVYHYKKPFIYLNTVAFYTGSLSLAGNPTPYSITPYLEFSYSDQMNLLQRFVNSAFHTTLSLVHSIMVRYFLDRILQTYVHPSIPSAYDLSRNVSLILQNGHFSMTYPRPYLPGVVEIACIHCRSPKTLPKHLDDFVNGGQGNGFIYVAMGSSVRAANMPKDLRVLFLHVFALLPYQILWKWEAAGISRMSGLPENVMLGQWFPQQDLLGHPKIKAFVTHGGLLSLFETVYHKVPVVAIPVFCDHDANVRKAVIDGYAIRLYLRELTASKLFQSITDIVNDPKYKRNAEKRSMLFRDQLESPLERAVYWTEYVLRYKGAYHLQSAAKDMSVISYYLLDVILLALVISYLFYLVIRALYKLISSRLLTHYIKLKLS